MARTDTTRRDVKTNDGAVVGMFRDRARAESAIQALKDAGFDDDRISVAMRDKKDAAQLRDDTGTEAAEGAATGAVSGTVVGGALGLLAGVGALAIPGLGLVAAGWLGSTLIGAGVGAAAGGIVGGLIGMGIPEEDARRFDESFREGGILVAVDAGARSSEATAVLRRYDADVSGADLSAAGRTTGAAADRTTAGRTTADSERTMELREEELDIDKHRVKTGEVAVRKETVTETKSIDVPVTREEVVVERRPAGGQAASGPIGSDREEMRIPISEDEVDVRKRTVAREEVSVGKRQVHDTERVTEQVGHEELRVEGADAKTTGKGTFKGPERRRRHTGSYNGPERRQLQL